MSDMILDDVPMTVTGFTEKLASLSGSPEGAATAVILGIALMAIDRELGWSCLRVADPTLGSSRRRFVEERLDGREYLPNSYIVGTSPENRYRPQQPPLVIRFSGDPRNADPASDRVKLFVECSGADSPRPVTMTRGTDGKWTATEWSSLLTGIRPPVS